MLSSSTGGHAIPVLEVYKRVKTDKTIPLIIHSGSKIEKEIFRGTSNVIVRSGKLNKHQLLTSIGEFGRIIRAFVRAFCMIIFNRPEVIFSKGGFNAAPFLYWARVLGVPYFLHESDIEMGAANKYFYKQILYINKDTSEMLEHWLPLNEEMLLEADRKMDKIITAVKDREVPKRSCADRFCETAMNCPFVTKCFEE